MKIAFVLLFAFIAACSASHSPPRHPRCRGFLCQYRRRAPVCSAFKGCNAHNVGALFRYSDYYPNYWVQCSNTGPVCRSCPDYQIYNEKNSACVRAARSYLRYPPYCPPTFCHGLTDRLYPFNDYYYPRYFVQCSNGTPYLKACPATTVFSYSEQVCIHRFSYHPW
ncbi:uncharacterized protein [Clytia hemisphaerica]|uniref:Chitin-binding type-2 domain-containing protein n=1 Tax=Clytia hemisphaerica TaxID=252671 RepID=A0A7M5X6Z8_9CNID|eukprot:TCONS_00018190-protein